jgi:poly-gamma-glutamate capsule biosynthesis protein CapA/YwtB (metallophosphatase superfamily)
MKAEKKLMAVTGLPFQLVHQIRDFGVEIIHGHGDISL